MSIEIDNETGLVMTETVDGCTMPADYSFAVVNDFVHRFGTNFEDLQALCLGMVCEIEKLQKSVLEERESCARICEESCIPFDIDTWLRNTKREMTSETAKALARLIRDRGNS